MWKTTTIAGDGSDLAAEVVVVGCFSDGPALVPGARALDRALSGALAAPLTCGDLSGAAGRLQLLYLPRGSRCRRALVVGLGAKKELDFFTLRSVAGTVGRAIRKLEVKRAHWLLTPLAGKDGAGQAARAVTEGFALGAYRAPRLGGGTKRRPGLPALAVITSGDESLARVRAGVKRGKAVADGVCLARDLINQPGNRLTPAGLATAARKLARASDGVTCRVMGKAQLTRMGAGGLLAVGQGSANPPCLIELAYTPPRGKKLPHVCVVGKGITFDTGGISLKPAANMEKMKYDMGGAGAVLGIVNAVAALRLPVRVTGLLAAAENMPGARAYKPGDVITQLNGTTVEVVNTDAEGRIVLGDALAHAVTRKPDLIVDLATLTGACTIALGSQAVALLGNDDELAGRLTAAGRASGERLWRLPLWKQYRPLMASPIADLRNSGGREAGTITAAVFLEKFVDGRPWAHLDIAGTAWSNSDRDWRSKGATGAGVALVTQFLADLAG